MLKISHDYGLPIVKAFEGCLRPVKGRPGYFSAYYCPANVLTIGWGHTNHHEPKFDDSTIWSQQKCDEVLAGDMGVFERRVDRILSGVRLEQNEYDALVSFDYNTGGLDRSSIPAKIKGGRRAEVADTLDRWNKANGKVLNGLVRRRKSEGMLFDGKKDEALRVAGASRGVEMPQRVDRPKPPANEVVKRAGGEIGTAAAGAAGAGGGAAGQAGTTKQPPGPAQKPGGHELAGAAMMIGATLMVVGLIALFVKYRKIDADWA